MDSKDVDTRNKQEAQAKTLSSYFDSQGSPDFQYSLHPLSIDLYGSQHVEKWVEKIGYHISHYLNYQAKPNLSGSSMLPSSSNPYDAVSKLTHKSFSGDVSGSIGEALLADLMRRRYGIKSDRIMHLRPAKINTKAPDFLILNAPKSLFADLFDIWRQNSLRF